MTTDRAPPCAAPDRTPRAPGQAFPSLACDAHAHTLGPAARFPYAADRVYTPPDSTIDDYLALLRTLGCERAVLVQPSCYGTDNAAMLDALARVGPGLRAVAVAAPDVDDATIQAWHDAGVRGLRFNLVDRHDARNQVPVEALRALGHRVAAHGWHLELLVNLDEAGDFAPALADLGAPVVLGHFGYPKAKAGGWPDTRAFADLKRLIDGGRSWIKLTGPYRITAEGDLPYGDVDAAARALIAHAPERMIWGSDWPHVMMKQRMANDGDLADLLARWEPDAAMRKRILVDNPARLYGFGREERIDFAR